MISNLVGYIKKQILKVYYLSKLFTYGLYTFTFFIIFIIACLNKVSGQVEWDDGYSIIDEQKHEDKTIIINGNLTIIETGSLQLDNVTIIINSSKGKTNSVLGIISEGIFSINNTIINSNIDNLTNFFIYQTGPFSSISNMSLDIDKEKSTDIDFSLILENTTFFLDNIISIHSHGINSISIDNSSGTIINSLLTNKLNTIYTKSSDIVFDNLTIVSSNTGIAFIDSSGILIDSSVSNCTTGLNIINSNISLENITISNSAGYSVKTLYSNVSLINSTINNSFMGIKAEYSALTIGMFELMSIEMHGIVSEYTTIILKDSIFKQIGHNAIVINKYHSKNDLALDNISFQNVTGKKIHSEIRLVINLKYYTSNHDLIEIIDPIKVIYSNEHNDILIKTFSSGRFLIKWPVFSYNSNNQLRFNDLIFFTLTYYESNEYSHQENTSILQVSNSRELYLNYTLTGVKPYTDLSINQLFVTPTESYRDKNKIITISANISNNGDFEITSLLIVFLIYDSTNHKTVIVENISNFKARDFRKVITTFPIGNFRGDVRIELYLNPFKDINELDYMNNFDSYAIQINNPKTLLLTSNSFFSSCIIIFFTILYWRIRYD